MAYTGGDLSAEAFEQRMLRTASRGPDAHRMVEVGGGRLGFGRLAIMDPGQTGMQPFCLDGDYLVCNGEIYGFRALRRALTGYRFAGQSDCEVLLPMYREYGLGMFARLDAEFALVLYDGARRRWVAARDPIGIRPLFYGFSASGHIAFASEAKNLVGLCGQIRPFPVGCYYADGAFVRYCDICLLYTSDAADD